MKVKLALSTLPLVLNACGGDESSGPDYIPNALGQGIWEGGFSSTGITSSGSGAVTESQKTQIEKEGIGLFTTDNKVFFYNVVDDLLFTHLGNNGPGFLQGTNSLIYGPVYYQNGNDVATVSFDGNAYISTKIIGQVSSPASNYLMIFDDAYFRGADLSRLAGIWTYTDNGTWSLDIENNGTFTGSTDQLSGCTFSGAFSTIDTSKNEYSISVTLGSGCSPMTGFTGIAATIDTTTTNDTIIMAINNSNNGFFMKLTK